MIKSKKTMKNQGISFIVADQWLKAKVVKGKGWGKKLGFPTLNLQINSSFFSTSATNLPIRQLTNSPALVPGVYFCQLQFVKPGFEQKLKGLLYYGPRSVFQEKKPTWEVYLFNFNQQIKLGTKVKFRLLAFLRPALKFKTKKALVVQLKKDVQKAQKLLKNGKIKL